MQASRASTRCRFAGLAALAAAALVSSAPATAQDGSGTDGGSTEGQDVSVSQGDNSPGKSGDRPERSPSGSSCGSSSVTVVTDEGTSHPGGGSSCGPVAAAASPSARPRTTGEAVRARRTASPTPSPTPGPTGTPEPTPVLILERPLPLGGEAARPARAGIPVVPILLAGVLIAGGVLTLRRRARLTQPAQGTNLLASLGGDASGGRSDAGDTQQIDLPPPGEPPRHAL